jgi:MiaB-like tRNA modifying enzyme
MVRRAEHFFDMNKPLIVSGCMAVVEHDALSKVHPSARFLKPKEINNINSVLDGIVDSANDSVKGLVTGNALTEVKPVRRLATSRGLEGDAGEYEEEPGESIDSIVPIATGCRGACTYCITRLARGELQSYPLTKILAEVSSTVAAGHYEIRLTAQDTGCYGYDKNSNLPELLDSITKLETPHEFRIRIGMMNPDSMKPILDKLIASYGSSRIFKFLHIPVQSGDNELLKAMGRKYTVEEFLIIIEKFRSAYPELTISTDFIVGYPGETEEQFEHSLSLMERLRANIVNITRFSARPGTPAAKLKNTLPGSTVKSRSRKMTELRFKISKELNKSAIGRKYSILVTERVKAGSVLGRTNNYQPVVVKQKLTLGSWVETKIVDATDSYLIGKVAS